MDKILEIIDTNKSKLDKQSFNSLIKEFDSESTHDTITKFFMELKKEKEETIPIEDIFKKLDLDYQEWRHSTWIRYLNN